MTKVTLTVYHYSEEFTHEDMGYDDEGWEALSESEQQTAIEEYAQDSFEQNVQYYTKIKD
jgi:hypothetical protein